MFINDRKIIVTVDPANGIQVKRFTSNELADSYKKIITIGESVNVVSYPDKDHYPYVEDVTPATGRSIHNFVTDDEDIFMVAAYRINVDEVLEKLDDEDNLTVVLHNGNLEIIFGNEETLQTFKSIVVGDYQVDTEMQLTGIRNKIASLYYNMED